MTQLRGKIEKIEVKTTSTGRDLFLITIAGKETSTFKREFYNTAQSLRGSEVVAQTTEKQNGQWVNTYLDSLEPVGVAAFAATGGSQTSSGRSDVVQAQIMAQWALGVAWHANAQFPEAERGSKTVDQIAQWNLAKAMEYAAKILAGEFNPKPVLAPEPTPDDDIPY